MSGHHLRATMGALVLLAAVPARGTAQPAPQPRLEKVGDGIYAIIHPNATEEWPNGNTGVIIGDDGVLVIDAGYLPSTARADIALIRTLTDKPVRYLVYTHWHFDHNNGGIAYREAFPDVTIVSERSTARYIDINGNWWKRAETAPDGDALAILRDLDSRLRSGMGSDGRPLSDEARAALRENIRQRDAEYHELSSLTVVTPTRVFDDRLTLSLGSREIQLVNRGHANSPADTTVYVPDAHVLFTGDIVVQSPLPFTRFSWPLPWIQVLRELEGIPVAAVVPGHGPVQRGQRYTAAVRGLLERTVADVERLVRAGRTLEQVEASVDLSDVRRSVPEWRAAPDEAWRSMVSTLVERVWRGVRGQG